MCAESPISPVKTQLDQYFATERRSLHRLSIRPPASPFDRRVLTELSKVPFGELTTYGALGAEGSQLSARSGWRSRPQSDPHRLSLATGS